MTNWQLTATTVICDACGQEVTIIVYKNGQAKCTGAIRPVKGKKLACECSADACAQVSAYKAKLAEEERID